MKYDIFISYSRKDFEEVNQFVGMLKERIPSLTCWFDITGIESGDEFEDKIITAIDNSAYVLFALSDHSIQSQWTKDEVMYAKNSNKKVIPLLLKGAELKGWFLFKFGRIDCIDTTNSLQIEKLVKNLCDWIGKAMTTVGGQKVQTTPSEPNMQVKIEEVRKELHEASLPKEHEDYSARKEMETMPTESEPKWYSSSWKKWLFPVAACLLVALAFICWPKGEAAGGGGTALDTQAFAVADSIPPPVPTKPATPTSVEEEVPAPSLLYVTTSPTGATVYVDGKKVGTSPIEGKEVTRGRHTLRISKNGYESITEKKEFGDKPVVLNETLVADVKAVSPPVSSASTVPTTGTINGHTSVEEEVPAPSLLYVTTNPSGATVYVDGKKFGTSPIEGKEVARGRHTVRITKSGYESISKNHQFGDRPVVLNETLVSEAKEVPSVQPAASQSSTPQPSSSRSSGTGTINGRKYVDLGLSVKWADRNVGASSPSDYGDYFAWGETSTKSAYSEENSVTYEKSFSDIGGKSQYDAARANWGGSWRLPTEAECVELNKKCTWTWTTQGGHNGYKVTGPNGNSIFLPAAGSRDGASLNFAGHFGYYWSSTSYGGNTQRAYYLEFYSSYHIVRWDYRDTGLTVRPVSD